MLPKKQKISRKDFPPVASRGRTTHSTFLTLRCRKNNAQENKFSIVVSRKVAPKAIVRNKLKRRGYAILGEITTRIKNKFSCIIYFKKGVTSLSHKELSDEITKTFQQAHII